MTTLFRSPVAAPLEQFQLRYLRLHAQLGMAESASLINPPRRRPRAGRSLSSLIFRRRSIAKPLSLGVREHRGHDLDGRDRRVLSLWIFRVNRSFHTARATAFPPVSHLLGLLTCCSQISLAKAP